ncbi:hypothetical protein DLJ47_04945 [Micromonospora sp. S4605]|nr:hypothetical protein DLJ47_04945 [Micromonospora sp. S4605]
MREYPAISLLLTTTPSAVLAHADALRLDTLAEQAASRVPAELQPAAAPAVRRLHDLVCRARGGPAGHALAVFASAGTGALIRLPLPVRDRAVVDPTFATRDLVRALHRTPRHLVLALNARQARLFNGVADSLLPALTPAFPLQADRPAGDRSGRADRTRRSAAGSSGPDVGFLRRVDQVLGAYARLHPAPLVIVGDESVTTAFRQMSVNCARLAGVVRGNLVTSALPDLSARIRHTLDAYLHQREAEALALIDRRAGADRVASGMPAAWLAARTGRPEMLAVDETLFYPARLSDDGDTLTPATDAEHPAVIDDAVDELIELVLLRDGWVALTSPGALHQHGGVALALRRR